MIPTLLPPFLQKGGTTRWHGALWCGVVGCLTAAAWAEGPVAVFAEVEFPYYNASAQVTPEFVGYCLNRAGIGSEYVLAEGLADPEVFNVKRTTAARIVGARWAGRRCVT